MPGAEVLRSLKSKRTSSALTIPACTSGRQVRVHSTHCFGTLKSSRRLLRSRNRRGRSTRNQVLQGRKEDFNGSSSWRDDSCCNIAIKLGQPRGNALDGSHGRSWCKCLFSSITDPLSKKIIALCLAHEGCKISSSQRSLKKRGSSNAYTKVNAHGFALWVVPVGGGAADLPSLSPAGGTEKVLLKLARRGQLQEQLGASSLDSAAASRATKSAALASGERGLVFRPGRALRLRRGACRSVLRQRLNYRIRIGAGVFRRRLSDSLC